MEVTLVIPSLLRTSLWASIVTFFGLDARDASVIGLNELPVTKDLSQHCELAIAF